MPQLLLFFGALAVRESRRDAPDIVDISNGIISYLIVSTAMSAMQPTPSQ